jgi:catechol 2,3-dioxygenase-like lactoylglutathione lyase family enzyme
MTIKRLDNIGIIVDDLDAAIEFFTELGPTLEGRARVEGRLVDRVIGTDGAVSDIAMMRTPDGNGRHRAVRGQLSPLLSSRAGRNPDRARRGATMTKDCNAK